MKKRNILMTLLLGLISLTVLAQTDTGGSRPVKTGDEWQMPKDVLMRSKYFADSLQKQLGLDEATRKKVFNAWLANTKPVDEIRMGAGSEQQKKVALADNHEKFVETMKGILTPPQFERYVRPMNKAKTQGRP